MAATASRRLWRPPCSSPSGLRGPPSYDARPAVGARHAHSWVCGWCPDDSGCTFCNARRPAGGLPGTARSRRTRGRRCASRTITRRPPAIHDRSVHNTLLLIQHSCAQQPPEADERRPAVVARRPYLPRRRAQTVNVRKLRLSHPVRVGGLPGRAAPQSRAARTCRCGAVHRWRGGSCTRARQPRAAATCAACMVTCRAPVAHACTQVWATRGACIVAQRPVPSGAERPRRRRGPCSAAAHRRLRPGARRQPWGTSCWSRSST